MPTRFEIAKKDIFKAFEDENQKVFMLLEISRILMENHDFWRLPIKMTARKFIGELIKYKKMKKSEFKFPSTKIVRYSWGEVKPMHLFQSIQRDAYFSHYSAMYLHDLTLQIPKSVYVNYEQTPKPKNKGSLVQENINRAFAGKQRTTNNIAEYEDYKIHLLSGKSTDNLGVIEIESSEKQKMRVTNVERTLIDIAVRPAYAGGVFQVLEAFKMAKDKVSINKLGGMLKKLDYTYPYHQAIGLYLEKSGVYKESQRNLMRKFDIKYDFYLTHKIKEKEYSDKWKIYYPKGF